MTAPANRSANEVDQRQIAPVLNMVYNPSSGQIEPQTSSSGGGGGGDASAANQTTEIARLTSILSSVQLAATEATLAAITPKLEEMRVLLNYPKNTSYQQGNSCTPSDTIGIGTLFEAISVNFDGNVKMQLVGGTEPITVYLRAGVVYPFKVEKVFATGTTATGITVWR